MTRRAKVTAGLAGLVAAGALGISQGGGSIDVFVGSTPTPSGTPVPTANLWIEPSAGACTRQSTAVTYAASSSPDARCGALSTACTAANGGDTVLIKAGTYTTTWAGCTSAKTPQVTFRAASGELVTLGDIELSPVGTGGYFSLDGVTLNNFDSDTGNSNGSPSWKNITIKNSTFTGVAYLRFCGSQQTNVVFDHNLHDNIDPGLFEGRIHLPGAGPTGDCGAVIENSILSNGISDGIQTGVDGLEIRNNLFENLIDCGCGPHTDPIQLFGVSDTIVSGNWIHNATTGIMNYDGGNADNVVENNVLNGVAGDAGFAVINLGGGTRESVIHNTILGSGKAINFGSKAGQQATNVVVRDNITPGGVQSSGSGSAATYTQNDYNLCTTTTDCAGAHRVTGSATFTGGATPSTMAGFVLTGASLGLNAASDGLDMGATTFTTPWVGAGNPND